MNEEERNNFVIEEIKAIYEEFDNHINQLVLLRHFLKDLTEVANGAEPNYQFSNIIKFNKKH